MNSFLQSSTGCFLIILMVSLSACKKEEGFGGKVTVKGKIIEKIYDKDFLALHRTRPCADEDVFLIFGDNEVFDDDTKTSASGDFEFKYLLPGNYKIYFYSLDSTNYYPGNKIAVIKEFSITKSDDVIDLGELIKYKTVDYDEGNAIIKGNLTEFIYDTEFSYFQKSQPAADKDIFLTLSSSNIIIDDTKTSSDGYFEFKYLLPGDYKIYFYSADSVNHIPNNNTPVYKQFTVTENDKTIDLGQLKKYKTLDYDEGNVIVRGNLLEFIYDTEFSYFQKSQPAADKDIFLTLSNSNIIIDDTKTSSDGSFEFKYLIPGDYKIYFYSADSVNQIPNNDISVFKEFTVTENDKIIELGNFKKYKTIDYNDGYATIKGVLMTKYFINNFTFIREVSPSQNEDAFLVFNNHAYIDDRIRTMYDGSYAFPNLIKGKYKVYALSDNPSGASQKLQVYREIDITEENQIVTLDTLYINNE